jgi:hypothetical protein
LELTLAAAFNAFGVLRGFCRKLGAMVGVQMIFIYVAGVARASARAPNLLTPRGKSGRLPTMTLIGYICSRRNIYAGVSLSVKVLCLPSALVLCKFQARNLPDRIFCGTYAEVSNLRHAFP